MALSFRININRDLDAIEFIDDSDYGSLTGDNTDLEVTYPLIADNDPIVLDVAPENTALGGNAVFFRASFTDLPEFIQGVYRFELKLYDGVNPQPTATEIIYVIDFTDVLLCRRNLVTALIDGSACAEHKSWDDVYIINSVINTANREAEEDRFVEAQEMVDFLALKCETLDCACS